MDYAEARIERSEIMNTDEMNATFIQCRLKNQQQTGITEMESKDYSLKQKQIARFAKAMGHPVRMAILDFLVKQDTCFFGNIHEVLPIAKATVSQHLKELKDAGLIQGEVEAPKVKYCINRKNWEMASTLFVDFFNQYVGKKENCCDK